MGKKECLLCKFRWIMILAQMDSWRSRLLPEFLNCSQKYFCVRELPRVPLRGEGSCGVSGVSRDSAGYMTTGKTKALTRQTFVSKVMSLLFNMLSRLVITFLPRNKCLLISWLQSPSAVIWEPKKIVCQSFSASESFPMSQLFA